MHDQAFASSSRSAQSSPSTGDEDPLPPPVPHSTLPWSSGSGNLQRGRQVCNDGCHRVAGTAAHLRRSPWLLLLCLCFL